MSTLAVFGRPLRLEKSEAVIRGSFGRGVCIPIEMAALSAGCDSTYVQVYLSISLSMPSYGYPLIFPSSLLSPYWQGLLIPPPFSIGAYEIRTIAHHATTSLSTVFIIHLSSAQRWSMFIFSAWILHL